MYKEYRIFSFLGQITQESQATTKKNHKIPSTWRLQYNCISADSADKLITGICPPILAASSPSALNIVQYYISRRSF